MNWIKTTETDKLPEDNVPVLAFSPTYGKEITHLNRKTGLGAAWYSKEGYRKFETITHFQHLPENPWYPVEGEIEVGDTVWSMLSTEPNDGTCDERSTYIVTDIRTPFATVGTAKSKYSATVRLDQLQKVKQY